MNQRNIASAMPVHSLSHTLFYFGGGDGGEAHPILPIGEFQNSARNTGYDFQMQIIACHVLKLLREAQ
jgi:hypothetical protein